MTIQRDIRSFRLDSNLFNQDLYKRLLENYLPSYPEPRSIPNAEDMKRWFGLNASPDEKAAIDEKCREICLPALNSIGPAHLGLPPFQGHAAERKLYDVLASPFLDQWRKGHKQDQLIHGDTALALVLLLDQMSRNCFRGDAQGVVYNHYDRLARAVAHAACEAGFDVIERWKAAIVWRHWFYMPLVHSEDLENHALLREKHQAILDLAKERGDDEGVQFIERVAADKRHVGPLERFGRFPWRNKYLGRKNTPEEDKFLEAGEGIPMS